MTSPIEEFGLRPTEVFDTYWSFAAKRQDLYWSRVQRRNAPARNDPILAKHRFTNVYRALDRVSQYLIADVQRGEHAAVEPIEAVFRTLLFKIFNRIDTWEALEAHLGPIRLDTFDFSAASCVLSARMGGGRPIYSAAYIMPSPDLGCERKHDNHLAMLRRLFVDEDGAGLQDSRSLAECYEILARQPGIGPFLAFQFAIDLGYLDQMALDESDFVVAGPGARDGIAKCFSNWRDFTSEEIIMSVRKVQRDEFTHRGISFRGIPGRDLQPIDCQNLFCEVSKYARLAHPDIAGIDGRTRIKQRFVPRVDPIVEPVFPSHWGVSINTSFVQSFAT